MDAFVGEAHNGMDASIWNWMGEQAIETIHSKFYIYYHKEHTPRCRTKCSKASKHNARNVSPMLEARKPSPKRRKQ